MTITIDWAQKVINVNKIDMTLIQSTPKEIYELDLDVFRLRLKDLEDDEAGMPNLDTHTHNTTVSVGGATLARVVQIINGYTVTFEDGQYAVNLVGANSNVGDVVNVNQVSIRSANSAGLQDLGTITADTARTRKHLTNRFETNPVGGVATLYDDDGVTILETAQLSEDVAAAQTYRGQGAERRDGFA